MWGDRRGGGGWGFLCTVSLASIFINTNTNKGQWLKLLVEISRRLCFFSVLLSAGKESVKGRPREVCDQFVNSSKLSSTTNYDKPLHLLPWLRKPVNRFSLTDHNEILPHKYFSNVVTASFLYRTKNPSLQPEITPRVPWSTSWLSCNERGKTRTYIWVRSCPQVVVKGD